VNDRLLLQQRRLATDDRNDDHVADADDDSRYDEDGQRHERHVQLTAHTQASSG